MPDSAAVKSMKRLKGKETVSARVRYLCLMPDKKPGLFDGDMPTSSDVF